MVRVEGAERRWFGDGDQIDKWRRRSSSAVGRRGRRGWTAARLGPGRAEVEPGSRAASAAGGNDSRLQARGLAVLERLGAWVALAIQAG